MQKLSFLKPALPLTVICVVIALLLAVVNAVTADKIEDNARKEKESAIEKIFPESEKIVACGDYLTAAGKNDYCFCEEPPITLENSEKIIIYRWNRPYPADRHFHFDLEELGYELASTEEFIGNSHPTITEQIYKKVR